MVDSTVQGDSDQGSKRGSILDPILEPLLETWSESPCTVLSTTSYGPCWIILDPILEPLLVGQLVGLYQTSFGQPTYI